MWCLTNKRITKFNLSSNRKARRAQKTNYCCFCVEMRPARGGAARGGPARGASRPWAVVQPIYEEFRPVSEWQQDEESEILLIFLPGFLRQHLKVSTEGKNIVRVRGERLVAGNKWSRFQEDFQVPDNCNIRAVRARFEGGILTIIMPWKKDSQPPQDRPKETPKLPTPPNPDFQKQEMSPEKSPKAADDIPPKTISPAEIQKQSAEPRPQKGVDDIPPKTISPAEIQIPVIPPKVISPRDTERREKSPRKLPIEPRPQKGVDDYSPKVLIPPPSITAEKGKEKEQLSEPKTIKGQDEKRGRTISHEPMTFQKDVVERKETRSDTKAKITQSEKIGKSKEGTEKISKEAVRVRDQAENYPRFNVANDREKSEKIQEDIENKGKRERQTATRIAQPSGIGYGLGNYEKRVKSLVELNEERQMLVNIGVAVLVIVALGTYISYTVGSDEA